MREKDRAKLVRANFDAYSDLVWAESLEPKFRALGVAGADLEGFRAAWNRYTERRDWEWWQEHTAKTPNAVLEKETEECRAEIAALGVRRQQENEQHAVAGKPVEQRAGRPEPPAERYEDVLNRHSGKAAQAPQKEQEMLGEKARAGGGKTTDRDLDR